VAPLRFLVRGEFEEELGGFGFAEAGLQDFGGNEGGESAEGVDAEEGEALGKGAGEDEGDDEDVDGKAGGAGGPREDEDGGEA